MKPDASASGSSENMDRSGNGSSTPSAAAPGTDVTQPSADSIAAPTTSDEAEHLSEAVGNIQIDPESPVKSQQKSRGKEPQVTQSPHQPYYFYQALPQFYLSPLDIRILKAAFGDLLTSPLPFCPG